MKIFQKQLETCTPCPNVRIDDNKTRLFCGRTGTHLCWLGEKVESDLFPDDDGYHDLPWIEDAIPIPKNCPLPNIEEVTS